LDQFPRCIYRGQSLAFQYDDLVAGLVREVVCERKWFSAPGVYVPIQRLFLGVALQHQEDMEAQHLGVEMAGRVAEGACKEVQSWVSNLQGYPMEHHDVMERFGRFPGRNAALVLSVACRTKFLCVQCLLMLYYLCEIHMYREEFPRLRRKSGCGLLSVQTGPRANSCSL
jgi:uncharacterized protein (DUF924 family)